MDGPPSRPPTRPVTGSRQDGVGASPRLRRREQSARGRRGRHAAMGVRSPPRPPRFTVPGSRPSRGRAPSPRRALRDPDAPCRFGWASSLVRTPISSWTYPPGGFPGYTCVDSGLPEGTIPGGISALQGGTSLVTVFAGVADVKAALDQAVALGGTIVQPAVSAPGVTFGTSPIRTAMSSESPRTTRGRPQPQFVDRQGLEVSLRGPATR